MLNDIYNLEREKKRYLFAQLIAALIRLLIINALFVGVRIVSGQPMRWFALLPAVYALLELAVIFSEQITHAYIRYLTSIRRIFELQVAHNKMHYDEKDDLKRRKIKELERKKGEAYPRKMMGKTSNWTRRAY